jgi:hypothetical protein
MEALLGQEKSVAPQEKMKKAEGVKLILVPTSLSASEWNYTASCTNRAGKKQHFSLLGGGAPDLILMDLWVARTSPETLEKARRDLSKGLVEYREGSGRGKEGEVELIQGVSKCQAGRRWHSWDSSSTESTWAQVMLSAI